jgi:tRNA (guanine37-N1)-methyltransferase
VVRLVPGVLGDPDGAARESFTAGRLDYPQYTRPAEFRGLPVPEVLLSGDHARIRRWRAREAFRRTAERRPDLLDTTPPTDEERRWLAEFGRGGPVPRGRD